MKYLETDDFSIVEKFVKLGRLRTLDWGWRWRRFKFMYYGKLK
jgi:hypothetical protein